MGHFRGHVNKHKSANKFKRNLRHSKAPNVVMAPNRGGWRL